MFLLNVKYIIYNYIKYIIHNLLNVIDLDYKYGYKQNFQKQS